jgi:hypothetical protein
MSVFYQIVRDEKLIGITFNQDQAERMAQTVVLFTSSKVQIIIIEVEGEIDLFDAMVISLEDFPDTDFNSKFNPPFSETKH